MGRVEDRNDEDSAHVIGNGQRGNENFEGEGHAPTEQREQPEREGRIGGHRYAPPACAGAAGVQQHVEDHRHDQAAAGGDDRQQCPPCGLELPDRDFPFDLETHDEEEQRHES